MSSYTYKAESPMVLHNGDSMNQKEFHRLYLQQNENFKAELLDGTVFVCEPLSEPHGGIHPRLSSIFDAYAASIPGIQTYIEPTVILSDADEVQPDLVLRILPNFKGQTSDVWYRRGKKFERGPFIKGAPELVAEIAYSSRSVDLHLKRRRYESAGVLEYIVVCLEQQNLLWFDLAHESQVLEKEDGIFRSKVFPGFWIHEQGLFDMDYKLVMDTVHMGSCTVEHQEFVKELKSRR